GGGAGGGAPAAHETVDAALRAAAEAKPEPVAVNEVPTSQALMLRRAAQLAQTIGVIAAVVLAVLMLQAVVIAGGAAVPGVEKAVTASTWALILALCVLPLGRLMPEVAFSGVFVSYDALERAADLFRAAAPGAPGPWMYYGVNLALPLLLIAGIAALVLRFHAGIEAGIIVTNLSELDERLEAEIRQMKFGNLESPRAMGALNRAIGDIPTPEAPGPGVPPLSARAGENHATRGLHDSKRPI
ncbi:MAG: hypothetical protein IBJ11_12530, partial [Phycisphaerales bacterium]|nr:hypothetical protein [Phycisphaerales bacterium]